jgi:hypothetical protein
VFLSLIFSFFEAKTQTADSINAKFVIKKAIIPAVLIGAGLLLNNDQLEQDFQTDLRNKVGNDFEFSIDDYAQYAPIAEMYLADVMGVKAKNHWFDQTKYLIISNIITSSITHGLKNLTLKTRPNGADFSFPSGHTTFAFTNATVVYNEFRQTAPVLAYSGYVFAFTTASFRMLNNKHWLSDVLVGAGIGILVTDLVYYFEPLKNFNPFKKTENLTFVPYKNVEGFGIYFSYKF